MSSDVTIIIQDGGALGSGGGVLPPAPPAGLAFAEYSDVPGSITSSVEVVSVWGSLAQPSSGARPLLVTDSVTGISAIRFDTGKTLALSAGQADYLHDAANTVLVVARQRVYSASAAKAPIDSSGGGATPGWQLQAVDSIGLGAYRILRPRVSDGSTWVIDHNDNFPANQYEALKTCVMVFNTSATSSRVEVDHALAYDDTFSVALPSGAGGSLTIGNCQWDFFAIEIYSRILNASERAASVDRLAARFQVDVVKFVASDDFARNLGFPSMAIMNDGRIIATYRDGIEHSGTDGVGHAIFSGDSGDTWVNDATIIPNDLSGEDVRESCVNVLANHDVIVTWFTTLAGGLDVNYWMRSTNNAGAWSAKTLVTFGYTAFEATSAPVVQKGSRVLWPVYVKNTADAFSSARVWYSDDNLATWTDTLLADGVADSRSYSEPGLLNVQYATPGLSIGDVFALIRDDAGTMYETYSATGIGSWAALTATGMGAHSAARIIQLASGTILYLGRPNAQQVATLYRRNGPGDWTEIPGAPALDAYIGVMIYGQMLELTAGTVSVIYSTQQGNSPNDHAISTFRRWPEWQVFGQMPLVISPSAPQTITSTQTQVYAALGAGDFVWSIPADATGSAVDSSTGVLTAGAGNGTGTLRCTDLNGYYVEKTFTVTGGATIVPPTSIDASNLTMWLDPTQGLGGVGTPGNGDAITAWTSADVAARVLTPSSNATSSTVGGHVGVTFNGTSNYFTGAFTVGTLFSTSSWTVGVSWQDTGSIADTGTDFLNAALLASVSDGYFALGTTATQIYAGQDADGSGTAYDIKAAASGSRHYAVVQYDAVAGKIFISVDGGSFDAGTTVPALGVSGTSINVGRSGVVGAYFAGTMFGLATWKSKLAGSNLSNLQAFLATTI